MLASCRVVDAITSPVVESINVTSKTSAINAIIIPPNFIKIKKVVV
jgi:hypothetical protein